MQESLKEQLKYRPDARAAQVISLYLDKSASL